MEKRRLFKMTEIEQNMLGKALADLAGEAETSALQIQVRQAPKRKLYLDDAGHALALRALNRLRSSYLAAGRYSDGIDAVILKLLHSRYRRVPAKMREAGCP